MKFKIEARLTPTKAGQLFSLPVKTSELSVYRWGNLGLGIAIKWASNWLWISAKTVQLRLSDEQPKLVNLKKVNPINLKQVIRVLWVSLADSEWYGIRESNQNRLYSYSIDGWKLLLSLGIKKPKVILKAVQELFDQATYAYYKTSSPIISDAEFDRLESYLREINPLDKRLKQIGSVETGGDKVELPIFMPSLDKIKPDGISSWLSNFVGGNPIVASQKVDGVSLLLLYTKGKLIAAYTRGNGEIGKDITHHIKYVPNVPKTLSSKDRTLVRGELMMSKSNFKKYETEFKNPRNMVAGLVNRNRGSEELKHANFIAYEIPKFGENKSTQLKQLSKWGFSVVPWILLSKPKLKQINDLYEKWRKGAFAADGIVLELDKADRKLSKLENPDYAVAYKMGDTTISLTTVQEVEWKVSKDGFIKPTVVFDPVELSGVSVERATAFNGLYIKTNKIGPGAKIRVTRSGDVIPYIVEVVKGAKAQMPQQKWDWNDTGVDCVVVSKDTMEQQVQRNLYFFQMLGAENIAQATIENLYKAGFKTTDEILRISTKQLQEIEGFAEKKALIIINELRACTKDIELPVLMAASGCFGRNFGYRRCLQLYKEFGDSVVDWSGMRIKDIANSVESLKGFSSTLALQFARGIPSFKAWIKNHQMITIAEPPKAKSHKLRGYTFVFTGVRSPDLEKLIRQNDGEVGNSVTDNTSYLITDNLNGTSTKLSKARSIGTKIITLDQAKKIIQKILG